MLWWVDLSHGILACDPFADAPELFYVPLPRVDDDELPSDPVNRGAYRCVNVSGGRLRHVQIHGGSASPVVTVWVLAYPARSGHWIHERSVALAEVWNDQSYLDTSLPRSIPALAFLHPTEPGKVYFFISSGIFGVDLRLRKVVEFNGDFRMPEPPPHLMRSSHFVHVWRNDPSCGPDVLPSCFRDKVYAGPYKKLIKRFKAARKRSTAAKPVTFAAAQRRLTAVKPVTAGGNGIRLNTIRDQQESMEMKKLQAKRMKFEALFSAVIESRKKNLPAPREQ